MKLQPYMKLQRSTKSGFTIVELLIVIVIIAILATITVVAFNGIQQRAKNTAVVTTVNQVVKLLDGYVAQYNKYPVYENRCLTKDNQCTPFGTAPPNQDIVTELGKIGTLPESVQRASSGFYGIIYNYWSERPGGPPLALFYSLIGTDQPCQLSNAEFGWNDDTLNITVCTIEYPEL